MKRRRLRAGEIPEDIMEEILQGIGRMANGETVLVAQDCILVQVEFAEKRRVDHWDDALPQAAFSAAAWQRLAARGARTQRLLWASTGVKNPEYDGLIINVPELFPAASLKLIPEYPFFEPCMVIAP